MRPMRLRPVIYWILVIGAAGILPAAEAQSTKAARPDFPAQRIHYYNGDTRVDLDLALDELEVLAPEGQTVDPRSVAAVLPSAQVVVSGETGVRIRLNGPAPSYDTLRAAAQSLRDAGGKVAGVAYPASGLGRSDRNSQVLTNRITLQLKKPAEIDTILDQFSLNLVEKVPYAEETYIVETANGQLLAGVDAAVALFQSGRVVFATPEIHRQQETRFIPDDPEFQNQWHLNHTGQVPGSAGNDVNIVPAWDIVTGGGINIAVVDSGVEVNHPDLLPNARTDIDFDIIDNDPDPTPASVAHGTSVAGIAAAAGDNALGVTGAAFDAGIVGVRLIEAPTTDQDEADAMLHQVDPGDPADRVHVNNNSWGPPDIGVLGPLPPLVELALQSGTETGRGGLGTVYVWAAGNGRIAADDVNYDQYASSRYTIAVGASGGDGEFSFYSEPGAPMLVNASSSYSSTGTTTTDITGAGGDTPGDYTSGFGGTSSAAPLAAGVVALMLDRNPGLGWRDVQHVLADTAERIDPLHTDWQANGIGRFFNHSYGFGRIDATAAVEKAAGWQNVPALELPVTAATSPGLAIPDDNSIGVTSTINLVAPANFVIEHVEVIVDITHTFRGDLRCRVTSPSGTVSTLSNVHGDSGADYDNWRFFSVAHWGENPAGAWELNVADLFDMDTGSLDSWQINCHGYLQDTSEIWTDFDHTGVEMGTVNRPFNTLGEAAARVDAGGVVKMHAGISAESATIDKAVRLKAVGGTVRIGG